MFAARPHDGLPELKQAPELLQKPPEYGHNLSGQSMNRGRVLEALGLAAVLGLAAWLRLGWRDY